MEPWIKNSKNYLEKNKVGGLKFPYFKTKCLIQNNCNQTGWHWHKDRHIESGIGVHKLLLKYMVKWFLVKGTRLFNGKGQILQQIILKTREPYAEGSWTLRPWTKFNLNGSTT